MATQESATVWAGAVCVLSKIVGSITITATAVTEGSTSWIIFAFADREEGDVVPTKVTYRIDCVTTGKEIVGNTVLWDFEALPRADLMEPAASVEIILSSAVNTLADQHNPSEIREITVEAGFSTGGKQTASVRYTINGLRYLQ
jgi:hypothetical protein